MCERQCVAACDAQHGGEQLISGRTQTEASCPLLTFALVHQNSQCGADLNGIAQGSACSSQHVHSHQ